MALKLAAFTCPTCGSNEVARVDSKTFACTHCGNTHNMVEEQAPVRVINNHNVNVETGVMCAACGFVNEKDATTCGNCNAPLYTYCPSCYANNHAFRRFCGDCGEDMVVARVATAKEKEEQDKLLAITTEEKEDYYARVRPQFDLFVEEYAEWVGRAKMAIGHGSPREVAAVIEMGGDLQHRFFAFVGRATDVLYCVRHPGNAATNYVVEWTGVYKYHDGAVTYLREVGGYLGRNVVNMNNVMHTLLVKLLTKQHTVAARGSGLFVSAAIAATVLIGMFAAVFSLL